MSTKLFVGKLSYSTTERDLTDLFARAGTVIKVSVITDRMTGQPRGFAFVEMASEKEAQDAITQFNNYSLDGRNIVVSGARPQEQREGFSQNGNNYVRRNNNSYSGRRDRR